MQPPQQNQQQPPPWGAPPPNPVPSRKLGTGLIIAIVGGALALMLVSCGVGAAAAGGSRTAAKPGPTVTQSVTGPPAGTATVTATTTEQVTTLATVTFTPTPAVAFADGQYAVPSEVQPGTYHTDGGTRCYYAVLSDLSGGVGSIITNDNFSGPTTITIPTSAAGIQASGDCSWSRVG